MPARKLSDSVPPTISPDKAVEFLTQKVKDVERLKALRSDDTDVRKWKDTTRAILHAAFGKPQGADHEVTRSFDWAGFVQVRGPGYSGRGATPNHVIQREHEEELQKKKAVLESCI